LDGVTIASFVLDHPKKRAGVRASGAVHWLPPAFYEPVAALDRKYAGMDSAMRHWEAMMREVEIAGRNG
jgi:hypothetical protein